MKRFISGFILGALLFSGIAYAGNIRSLEVSILPLKYYFNLIEKAPQGEIKGFVYNGTTYVPIRFVAEALGKEVGWDGETSSIYIGIQPEVGVSEKNAIAKEIDIDKIQRVEVINIIAGQTHTMEIRDIPDIIEFYNKLVNVSLADFDYQAEFLVGKESSSGLRQYYKHYVRLYENETDFKIIPVFNMIYNDNDIYVIAILDSKTHNSTYYTTDEYIKIQEIINNLYIAK